MKILFLSRWFPFPTDNGSKIRIYHLIRSLAYRHTVDLVSFCSEPVKPDRLQEMKSFCRTVDTVLYQPYNPGGLKALLGFFSRRPRFLIDTCHSKVHDLVAEKIQRENYDLLIASQIDMVPYAAEYPTLAKIFEEIEVSQILELKKWQKTSWSNLRYALTWWKLSAYLKSLLPLFDGITTVSDIEREKLVGVIPGFNKMKVIPNGVDLKAPMEISPKPATLIYAGALTYQANFDAVDYFLREIFPLVQEKRPDVVFYVTGTVDGVNLNSLPQVKGVIFTGYLPSVSAKIAECWASVVPLRIGGGTRLKILESLGLGTPVITTSKGAEGLELVPERDVLIADDAESFACQVVRLLEDESLRCRLSRAGRSLVEEKYDWRIIGAEFCKYIEGVVENR
jgi:polysaccharide biosynthesis protein PslH